MYNSTTLLEDQLKVIGSNPISAWSYNLAIDCAIEVVREVLREAHYSLDYETATVLQQRLHQQKV
jgi:hypothetical protein